MPAPKSRNWCFTINNPGTVDAASLDEMVTKSKYLIVGSERGDSGTHHFQGFVMFPNQVRLGFCKELNERAHWEMAKGTALQAAEYCKKEGDFKEWGAAPMSQKRKGERGAEEERERWKRIRELAKVKDYETLEDEFPRELTIYEGAIDRLGMRYGPCQDQEAGTVNGLWIHGPAGTGKTYWAMHKVVDREKVYLKDLTKWWDGWDQAKHEVAVIDDMDIFHKAMARDFKIWVQEYEFNAEKKGGYMIIRPKLIIVTSNYTIEEIWDDEMTRSTMLRRFKVMSKYEKDKDPE